MKIMDLLQKLELKKFAPSILQEIVTMYLYGSSITERLTEESDVDIAILPLHNSTGKERFIIISKIEDIFSKTLKGKGIFRELSVSNLRNLF
jgi:predicted nucleotidyltransferase